MAVAISRERGQNMLIAVNAGNRHVQLGGYEEDARVFAASIATEPRYTADDYACRLQQVFGLYGVDAGRILRRAREGELGRRAKRSWPGPRPRRAISSEIGRAHV